MYTLTVTSDQAELYRVEKKVLLVGGAFNPSIEHIKGITKIQQYSLGLKQDLGSPLNIPAFVNVSRAELIEEKKVKNVLEKAWDDSEKKNRIDMMLNRMAPKSTLLPKKAPQKSKALKS